MPPLRPRDHAGDRLGSFVCAAGEIVPLPQVKAEFSTLLSASFCGPMRDRLPAHEQVDLFVCPEADSPNLEPPIEPVRHPRTRLEVETPPPDLLTSWQGVPCPHDEEPVRYLAPG